MKEHNEISIDYETYLISEGAIYPKPVCLSTYDGEQTSLLVQNDIYSFLSDNLNNTLLIAHNAVYECGVTVTHFPDLKEKVFDALDNNLIYCTKINEDLWNIQREKALRGLSLAGLVLHYYDVDISAGKSSDAWRLRYSELDNIPLSEWPQEAVDYAIDDSIWAHKIKEKQQHIDQSLALKSAVYLNLMGATGFDIDNSRVLLLEEEIQGFLNPHYDFLIKEGFCEYKKGKYAKKLKKLTEYISSLDVDFTYTAKGGVSTSGEALTFYMSQIGDNPVLKSFNELARYEIILSNYLHHLKSTKVYSQYSTTKNTGRTSSSSSKLFPSIAIQTMPRVVEGVSYDVRNCFIPSHPDRKIVSIDYSALELCSAAHQMYKTLGYSYMRDMLNEGDKPVDPHSKLAARRKKISYEEFMLHKSGKYKEDRQRAKPLNLSFPGGVGYDTMRYLMAKDGIKTYFKVLEKSSNKKDLEYYKFRLALPDVRIKRLNKREYALVQDELVSMKRDLFDAYPELEQFLKDTHTKFLTGEKKWKKNDFDEWEEDDMYMYSTHGFKRDWCNYTALCNGFLMQTPAAIGAQKAMNKLIRTFYNCPDITPKIFIHDECIFDVNPNRIDLIDEAADIMITEMQSVLTSVRIATEASMSDYWQKADGFWTKSYFKDAK